MDIDTSKFETVGEFVALSTKMEYPKKPNKSDYEIDIDGFTKESDYLEALANSIKEYENLLEEYEVKKKQFDKVQSQIFSDFKKFCMNKCLSDTISDEKKSMVFSYAYQKGHSGGMENVFETMVEISELVNAVHSETTTKQ